MEVQAVTILQAVKLNMTQYLTIEDSRIARLDTGLRKLRVPRVSLTREDDQGVTTQRLEDQLGDVDGRSQPRVLGSLESGGFSKVENGGVGDAGFVELLEPVDDAHLRRQGPSLARGAAKRVKARPSTYWHTNVEVDHPQHSFVLLGCVIDVTAMSSEKLSSIVQLSVDSLFLLTGLVFLVKGVLGIVITFEVFGGELLVIHPVG